LAKQEEHLKLDTKDISRLHEITDRIQDTADILDTGHIYGRIDDTLTILRKAKKGKYLKSLEKYHIFLASKQDLHMNEFGIDHNNHIYEKVFQQLKEYPHR
jgi:hypothetical protein